MFCASFLPRDVLLSAGVSLSVRPSVCLSDTLSLYCIKTAKDVVKLTSRPASSIILKAIRCYQIPSGTRSAGALNARGWKILRFLTEIAVYLGNGTRWAKGCYGNLIGSHREPIDPCQFRKHWVTLEGGREESNLSS